MCDALGLFRTEGLSTMSENTLRNNKNDRKKKLYPCFFSDIHFWIESWKINLFLVKEKMNGKKNDALYGSVLVCVLGFIFIIITVKGI